MKKVSALRKTLKDDISVASAINKITTPMQLTNKQKLFQTYEEHVNLEHEYAGDISSLSVMTYDEGEEFDGQD